MEAFDEMQLLYSKSNDFERHLSRSYLLEHGVNATKVIKEINGQNGMVKGLNGNGKNTNVRKPKAFFSFFNLLIF